MHHDAAQTMHNLLHERLSKSSIFACWSARGSKLHGWLCALLYMLQVPMLRAGVSRQLYCLQPQNQGATNGPVLPTCQVAAMHMGQHLVLHASVSKGPATAGTTESGTATSSTPSSTPAAKPAVQTVHLSVGQWVKAEAAVGSLQDGGVVDPGGWVGWVLSRLINDRLPRVHRH